MAGQVVIAADKFKGSLTAPQVASAVARGIASHAPDQPVYRAPVADGGDGTVQAAVAAGYKAVEITVTGPVGKPVSSEIAVLGDTAVVEVASASGLALLGHGELAPLTANSVGTGEAVRRALDAGCRTIVLGVGGSACTDGGAGMLTALGARLTDEKGAELDYGGAALADVYTVDLSGLDARLKDTKIVLASDVNNPLLGKRGAAHVYGPQKGANPKQVEQLDAALGHFAEAVEASIGREFAEQEGAGAAGGIGFAALAVLGATRRPGVDVILELVGFHDQLPGARLVITGEGALDEQTMHGKAPAGVAEAAGKMGVPVIAVAGVCKLSAARLTEAGISAVYTLADIESDHQKRFSDADKLLEQLGANLSDEWLVPEA